MASHECKNCGNTEAGTDLLFCRNCGKVYCRDCLPDSKCGDCGSEWFPGVISSLPFMPDNLGHLGQIEEDE